MTTEYVFCPKQESKIHIKVCSKCTKEYGNCKPRIEKLKNLNAFEADGVWLEMHQRYLRL